MNLSQNLCFTNCHPNKKNRFYTKGATYTANYLMLLLFQKEKLSNIIQHFLLLHLHVRNDRIISQ